MFSSSDQRGPVELLADEFLARCKRGEKPTIKEYCAQHPELADEIRVVFEALLMVEDLKPGSADVIGSFGEPVKADGKRLEQVGDYRILCEIGRGGMGVVYEAEQQALGRRVALKVLPRTSAGDGSAQVRFQREARAAARMHHTNIVPVFDVGQDGDYLYYAMQLIHGQGLDLVIEDLKRLRAQTGATPVVQDRAADRTIAASLAAGKFERENLAQEGENDLISTAAYEGRAPSSAALPGQSEIGAVTSNRGAYFRSVAQIGVQTASALSYAHSRGIIHRDIKPGNLILDTTGNVWVTDFGLAKTGDGGTTHSGDILGTVRYMSPERFRGQCDVRADVYALGMTLYEMVTLKAAFASGDRLKLIELIRRTEAASPRSIDARIPRDLETIVIKAIDKDPKRRYQSADEIGEDLQRFVNDEPIKARRIGSVERLGRWCRRNPAVAGLLTVVLLLIAAGVTTSTLLAVAATQEAATARQREADAKRSKAAARQREADARRSKADAVAARDRLARANNNLLNVGARGLLRPLAAHVQPHQPLPPLNVQEVEPLWELAAATDERLRLRTVELALDDPVLRRRLKDRAPFAFQAAVGLDPRRRTRVETLLGKRLKARRISPEQQEQVALCLAHLGGLERRVASRTADALIQVMSRTTDAKHLRSLAQHVAAVSARLEPKEASQRCGQAAAILIEARNIKTSDWSASRTLWQGLSAVSARLEPREAAEVAATLIPAMSKTALNTGPGAFLANSLPPVLARMEPKEAGAALTQAMSKTTDRLASGNLARSLSAVSARLEPKEAAATLARAMRKTTEPFALGSLAKSLSAVSARLEPKEAAQLCGQAAATLAQAMRKTGDAWPREFLAQSLSAVSARLEPKEAARLCSEAAATVIQAITTNPNASQYYYLAKTVSAVSARLEPKEAAEFAATLTEAMSKRTDAYASKFQAEALSAVSARLEPKEAAQVCGQAAAALIQAMRRTTDAYASGSLAEALSAVSTRLEPKEAAQVCGQAAAALIQAMRKTTNPNASKSLADALSAVSARLEPKEAAPLCGEAAATLIQAMRKTTNPNALYFLAQALSAVSARLEPKEAAELAGTLTQAMRKTKLTDFNVSRYLAQLRPLAQGLSAVAARLEPKEAAEGVATLLQAMSTTTSAPLAMLQGPKETAANITRAMKPLTEALSALSARLEPKEAAKLAASITQAMSTNWLLLEPRAQVLTAVAARLEPKEVAEVAAILTQAMRKTTVPGTLEFLAQGLSAVAARLEPKEAAKVAAALTLAIHKATDPDDTGSLAQALSAVSARLEQKEVAEVAATLTRVMSKTTDAGAWGPVAQSLSAVSARLEPKEAPRLCGQAAATLIQAMSKTTDPSTLQKLAQSLSAVLARALPPQTLVDLLKHPFCVGKARRLVLDRLARHGYRPFADQWDFVDYVHQRKLGLDLTTPPARSRMLP
jgi:serine/threonine protein kinase